MSCYRIYTLKPDGHIGGPPRVVEARYDDEAIKQARPLLGRADIEIWCGARLVRRRMTGAISARTAPGGARGTPSSPPRRRAFAFVGGFSEQFYNCSGGI